MNAKELASRVNASGRGPYYGIEANPGNRGVPGDRGENVQ